MRLVSSLVSLAAAVATLAQTPPHEDVVTWIPAGKTAGWSTPISRQMRPEGATLTPLLAPVWLPRLPTTRLGLLDGGSVDLASLKGKVVLVDFWASWCGPCLTELPQVQKLHVANEPRGLAVVAVNVDEEAEVARETAKKLGLTMPVALDDGVNERLGVRILPTVILADKKGRIRARWDGYHSGYVGAIDEKAMKLLADDPEGTLRPVAQVAKGHGVLRALWTRDLPGEADGVLALAERDGTRVVAIGGGAIMTFDGDGEIVGKVRAPSWAGRLVDFGRDERGTKEIAAFRPGSTMMGIVSLPGGESRNIDCGAPIANVSESIGPSRALTILTTQGPRLATGSEPGARPIEAVPAVLDVADSKRLGVLALYDDGGIGPVSARGPGNEKARGAARLLTVADDGSAAVGPRAVVAAALGRFLPGDRTQLAVATYSGHVALLDTADGALLVDLVWADARDLSAADLDGDGRDELVVGAGRFVTVLSAALP